MSESMCRVNRMTTERPDLDTHLDGSTFREYYYLKEELVRFCRQEGLGASGGKKELTERISHYLDTGEIRGPEIVRKRDVRVMEMTEDTPIETDIVCSETHRAFFVRVIGKGFTFNVEFQRWLRSNPGKSYGDAVNVYHRIIAERKGKRAEIDEQFEYNRYIRDFFADNEGRTLADAIRCWNRKKKLPGHNRYEKDDLAALDEKNG